VIFLFFTNKKEYIPIIGLTIYLSKIIQIASPLFGISLVFFIQTLLFLFFFLLIFYGNSVITDVFKGEEIKILFGFCIFIFLNHIFFGSSYRHEPFDYSFKPIIHLLLICLLINYALIQRVHLNTILLQLRIVLWLNLALGGFILIFSDMEQHTSIMLSESASIGFNSNSFAFMCVQLFLIELLFFKKFSFQSILLMSIPGFLCFSTLSRSGFLALLVVLFLWFIYNEGRGRMIFPIFTISTILFSFNYNLIFERFFSLGDALAMQDGSNIMRYQLIIRGLYMFLDYPYLGTGIGTYHMYRYSYPEAILISRADSFVDSHNVYVQLLAETGIVGFLIFILFFYFLFKKIKIYKIFNPRMYHYLKINMILYMLHGLFSHDFYRFHMLIPVLLGALYTNSGTRLDIKK
jgi:O-antigen ligase